MRRDLAPVLALAAAWWLWTDLTAVWGPSLITVLGQAGSTSPALLGLFALACVGLSFACVAAVSMQRGAGGGPMKLTTTGSGGFVLLTVALTARVVLAFVPGGSVQLWASSIGVMAAFGWIAVLAAKHGRSLATGVATGWLVTAALAAAGGTWLPVWRPDALGITATVLLVLVALASAPRALTATSPLSPRQAWTLFPLALVAGIAVINPGRASTIITDTGPLLLVFGCAAAALSVAALGRSTTAAGRVGAGSLAVVMVAASLWGTWAPGSPLAMELAWWLTPLLVAGPICLAVLLTPDLPRPVAAADHVEATHVETSETGTTTSEAAATTAGAPPSTEADAAADAADAADEALRAEVEEAHHDLALRSFADLGPIERARHAAEAQAASPFTVLQGAVVWLLGFFGYYAGYDVGYRADWMVVLLLLALVVWVAKRNPVPERTGGPPRLLFPIALAAVIAAGIGAYEHRQPVETVPTADRDLRVTAWNVRMGYGMDGTFDPRAVARHFKGSDVVLLSEIDRGWLLNGGQDQLAILAHLSGKRLYFAPAADSVWGDAVLTDLPVTEVRGERLGAHGAPTGAEALAVKVRIDSHPVWMVSTHLQPHDGEVVEQATEVAQFAASLASDGSAVVLGGDLNTPPESAGFAALTAAGLTDALADDRPAPTFIADEATDEIDHVLVSPALTVRSAGVGTSLASDHLPVWTTLTLRDLT